MPLTPKELERWLSFKEKYKTNSIFVQRVNEILITIDSENYFKDMREEITGE